MPERRAWAVPLGVNALAVGAWWTYNHAGRTLAEIAIVPYALCLVLGATPVYAALRSRRGAATAASAALVLPLLWLVKEMQRVAAVFGPGPALYYALNPLSVGLFCGVALQLAGVELVRRRRRGEGGLGGWPGVVLGGIALLALGAWLVGRDSGGRDLFYGYVAVYRALFPEG